MKGGLTLFYCILLIHVSQAQAYDYFQLALVWSSAYCNTVERNCIHQPVPHWTINGYWPMSNPDKPEMWCTGVPQLTPNDVAAMKDKLDLYWPNFTRPSNFEGWEYEWRAHGSCAEMPATEYFSKAISVFEKIIKRSSESKKDSIPRPTSYEGSNNSIDAAKVEL